jgi:hypothetical protein
MSYTFTVINTYGAFMKESESEVLKIEKSESELLCTDFTALLSATRFIFDNIQLISMKFATDYIQKIVEEF